MNLTLFLLLGYPGAGKSTVSRQLAERFDLIRINGDELRRFMFTNPEDIRNPRNNPMVFGALDYIAETLLASGLSVVYDANNNKVSDRESARKFAEKHGAKTVIVWIKLPLDVARERNDVRPPDEGYGRIPDERYDQLVANLHEPLDSETVIEIDGLATAEEQLHSFEDRARRLGVL